MKLSCLSMLMLAVSLAGFAQSQEPLQTSGAAGAGTDELRVAVVDIQALFKDYHKTLLAEKEINNVRAEIQKESQLSSNEIQGLRRRLQEMSDAVKAGTLEEAELNQIKREAPVLLRELRVMEKQKERERSGAHQKLDQQMARRMKGILREISELTQKFARESGLDLVIDHSGTNSSQVKPVLFIKDAVDITAPMKEILRKKEARKR